MEIIYLFVGMVLSWITVWAWINHKDIYKTLSRAMKKLFLIFIALSFIGCSPNYAWKVRPDKTDHDWEIETQECLDRSGVITGFFAFNPIALAINQEANKKNEQCLREKGWID